MIGKDDFLNSLYVKSKMTFKTTFRSLSKLAEQTKIRLLYDFERFLLGNKTALVKF